MQLESGKIIAIRTSANNKPNSSALPNQPFIPPPPQQPTQSSAMAYNRPQPLENSFNSGSKNGL